MNEHIIFRSDSLQEASTELKKVADALTDVSSTLSSVDTSATWWEKLNSGTELLQMLRRYTGEVYEYVTDVNNGVQKAISLFEDAENQVRQDIQAVGTGTAYSPDGSAPDSKSGGLTGKTTHWQMNITSANEIRKKFMEKFCEHFDWSDLLSGAGYFGVVYDFIQDFRKAGSLKDYLKTGKDVYDFLKKAGKTYNNYKKIGNAVGAKTARQWWLKSITGLKKVGRVSTASSMGKRFVNNLKNKTSPFNIKKAFGNLTGANGVGKAVTSWAGVAFDGVMNFFDNKAEQAASGGTMSDGRVVAETVVETAINTAATYGATAVVGAAISAAVGTVAAPGIVVAAGSALIITGINAGVEALTGKSATEWASDAIVDAGEAIGSAIGKGVSKAKDAVAGWFSKWSFA